MPAIKGNPLIVIILGKIELYLSHEQFDVSLQLQIAAASPNSNLLTSLFLNVILTYPYARSFLILIKLVMLTRTGPKKFGGPA